MDNGYVDGLRQLDSRPRSPVIVPHNLSELRKKILFENTLLEERALHEFSAGKGDGAGVDTGSAPLKPLTSPTPTPTPTPAPAGIPVASTASVIIGGLGAGSDGTAVKKVNTQICIGIADGSATVIVDSGVVYSYELAYEYGLILIPPQTELSSYSSPALDTPFGTWRWAQVLREDGQFYSLQTLNNPSTNPNFIPTTGWDAPITITAA